MNWDEMEVSGDSRHCLKCNKHVFDLTNCSIDEVIALQRKHGPICGSIKLAAIALSLSTAACQNLKQDGAAAPPVGSGDQAVNRVSLSGTPLSPEMLEKMKKSK